MATKRIKPFRIAEASAEDLRHEAEGLDDAAAAMAWVIDRSHSDNGQSLWLFRMCSSLRGKAGDLRFRAKLMDTPAVNQVPT